MAIIASEVNFLASRDFEELIQARPSQSVGGSRCGSSLCALCTDGNSGKTRKLAFSNLRLTIKSRGLGALNVNEHWFLTLDEARETIESWRIDYNQVRPHSALGYLTPEKFATGYANVESTKRLPHSHSLDGSCGPNLPLISNPSALTCLD